MRYAIVIEQAAENFSAYVPDLPGCIATGSTIEETEREEGQPIPQPSSRVSYVNVAASLERLS